MTCLPDIKMVNQMAENIFQKWNRASPLIKDLGWAGFAKYWATSTAPAKAPKPIGPTDTEVLASDERIRRALASRSRSRRSSLTGGQTDRPVKLQLPSLVGI